MQFLLVHSPLVGPSTWRFVADELQQDGATVIVPDLRPGAECGDLVAIVDIAVAAAATLDSTAPVHLVAHSGGGFFLPLIAARLGSEATTMCFVDAGIPEEGDTTPSRDYLERLRELAIDGILPKWSSWWGPDVMTNLIPDAGHRDEIEAQQPAVPLTLYETSVHLRSDWRRGRCSYLLLSEGYAADADLAESLSWPTSRRSGSHLDIVNDPIQIAREISRLAQAS